MVERLHMLLSRMPGSSGRLRHRAQALRREHRRAAGKEDTGTPTRGELGLCTPFAAGRLRHPRGGRAPTLTWVVRGHMEPPRPAGYHHQYLRCSRISILYVMLMLGSGVDHDMHVQASSLAAEVHHSVARAFGAGCVAGGSSNGTSGWIYTTFLELVLCVQSPLPPGSAPFGPHRVQKLRLGAGRHNYRACRAAFGRGCAAERPRRERMQRFICLHYHRHVHLSCMSWCGFLQMWCCMLHGSLGVRRALRVMLRIQLCSDVHVAQCLHTLLARIVHRRRAHRTLAITCC